MAILRPEIVSLDVDFMLGIKLRPTFKLLPKERLFLR